MHHAIILNMIYKWQAWGANGRQPLLERIKKRRYARRLSKQIHREWDAQVQESYLNAILFRKRTTHGDFYYQVALIENRWNEEAGLRLDYWVWCSWGWSLLCTQGERVKYSGPSINKAVSRYEDQCTEMRRRGYVPRRAPIPKKQDRRPESERKLVKTFWW